MFKTWEEMSRKEQLEEIYWDAFKDAYGIRPRHINVAAMTEEQLTEELSGLEVVIKENIAREEKIRAEAIVKFEEMVLKIIDAGSKTREAALRWIAESENYNGDWDYVCYSFNLPYGYFKQQAN